MLATGRDSGSKVVTLQTLPGDTLVFVCHDYVPNGRATAHQTSIAEQKQHNIHVRDGVGEAECVAMRNARDATLASCDTREVASSG